MVTMGVKSPDKMQNCHEASAGGLQYGEAIPHYPQYGGTVVDGSSNPNEGNSSNPLGGIAEAGLPNVAYVVAPTEGYHGPVVYPPDVYFWSGRHADNQEALQNHIYPIENQFYPMNGNYIPEDNQHPYLPFQKLAQPYQPEFNNIQEFQYFVVIDFEATCNKDYIPHPQEIIEFPAVLVNSTTRQLEDQFQVYVRPTSNPQLSDFCKELTGIQQTQVDKGVALSEALVLHNKWLENKGVKQTNFVVVTWSNWDCEVILESECRFKGIQKPSYFNRWINLRVPFIEVFGKVRCNLKEAVQMAGLTWEGRAHCGLDDARNTARLLTNLMQRGVKLTVTNSMAAAAATTEHQTSLSSSQPHQTKPQAQPSAPLHQHQVVPGNEQQEASQLQQAYCYCGVKCRRQVMHEAGGPTYACIYYSCGNSTGNGGALCPYFGWATI